MSRRLLLFLALLLLPASLFARERVEVEKHGKRIEIGTEAEPLTLLYLKGTPYEMGYAHGKLCSTEVRYLATEVAPLMLEGLKYTPKQVDQIWEGYTHHLRPEFLEELRGLADGSGVPLVAIQRFHAIPDISEWHCTFFAATANATGQKPLVQIRALDYETGAGIQKHPAVIISQPSKGNGFANVGWLGHIGLVTGMNAKGIAMSEIGDDWDKNTDNFDGRPLNFMMRETVQYSNTLQEAVDFVKNGTRTTSLLYCLSSATENQVRALMTSHTQCFVYDPNALPFKSKSGLVYMSMGMDSSWNVKVGNYLLKNYGNLDVEKAKRMMKSLGTGSLHAVVFVPAKGDIWVANATEKDKAYNRSYRYVNLKNALAGAFFQSK